MSIALGQAGFTSGGPAVVAALAKGAKGDFIAKNLEVPAQYIELHPKAEKAQEESATASEFPEIQWLGKSESQVNAAKGRGRAYNIHVVKRVSRDRKLQRGAAIW
ncbi:MAG: hypothetical protein BGO12_16355 [Verrucomicrobia bacterium 61-8]|nr:hypothetical protein [Verrucomicrobiota bacterium]OJV16127.1 MAG: hypothetical protein BGO12_16355 [Verrucomicrobia bacterium 61-8]